MYEQRYQHHTARKLNEKQLEEMLERRRKMKLNFTKPDPYRYEK